MDKTAGIFRRIFKHTPVIRFISCIIFLMSGISLYAQTTYPVQVFTQLTPPYTSYLPAYYTGVNSKLKVTLINTDMQQPLLNVYLRMSVKSSSFTIETPENVYTQRIGLQAGVPLQLSLNDLAVYFKNENMRVSGGRNEFLRTNMLPDNFYRFNFEVYEANTGRLLSNPKLGFAQAMIASGEPPVLNLPLKGTAIMESNIPSIMFSWTPRHMNSVASAYGTEYEFTLVEIYDRQVSPEAAFGFSRVLYTETVRSTSFIHTAAQPQLIPGMRYAWRVRAVAREGVEEANVFKNNGFSPVFWFDYTVDCKPVQFDKVEVKDRVAIISWQQSDAVGYDVQYRKKGSNKWYTGTLTDNQTCPVYNLKFGQEYEYRIGVRCTMNDAFTYSQPKGFSMPEELAKSANCGILPDINVSNQTPARELQARLPVLVGDFPVFITKVSGSGRFTGEGYVGIPYMKNAKIAVTFRDIVVNTDNRMIGGFIETKYDISSGKNLLWDADETLTGGKGVGDIRTGEEKAQYTVDYTINSSITKVPVKKDASEDKIKDGEASEATSGANERYIVTLTDDKGSKQEQVVDKFPATIEDKSGAVYEVDKEGNIKQVSSKSDIRLDDNTKYRQDTTVVSVRFEKTDNTRYALDVYTGTYNKVTEYEREYIVSETEPIRASAKLMLPDTPDEIFVRAIANDKGFDPAKVHFITESRTEYKAEYDSQKGGWTLSLVAPPANDGQLVYVVYDKGNGQYGTLAILKALAYEPKEVNVMLVPVNGGAGTINEGALQDEVNAIYNKFGVTVNLKVSKERFDYTPINGTFQIDGTGLFDTRTADMDALEAAFKKTGRYNDQTVYLFVMDKPSNVPDTKGDMPRDSRMGYLFPSYDAHTIAHEIGHGVFNLKHPFAKGILTNQFTKGELKDNLMDYPAGTGLAKLQWDALHSPGIVIGLFEKDGDAMYIGGTFYLADWTPVRFNYSSICETSDIVPSGTIEGIMFNNLPYSARYENNKWEYKNGSDILSGIEVVKDIKGSDKVYLIREVFEGCSEIYSTTHDYVLKNKENPNIFDGAEFEYYTGDCSKENAESQGIVIIRQCDEDPYYVKHRYAVQAADGTTTWGQKIIKNLNFDIQKNAKNKYGDDLDNVQLNSLHYINQGVNYKGNDIFSPSYIEELNHKLAYLEVSSGVQLYVRFIEVTCTFSQTEGSKFAKDIFENSEISKTKGIYVLVVRNTDATGELEWKTYFAFGSDISGDLKASAENLLFINNETKFPAFGTSLIQFYKKIPKKQKQYIYVIEKATQQESDASEHNFLTKRILSKTEIKENQTGNAIRAVYYLLDTETNALYSLNTETSESKELKEQYVADQGVDLGKLYAEKEAGWKLSYYDIRGERYSISPTIFDCKFTLEKTCVQQAIDAGFLIAGIASVPFGNAAVVLDGLAVGYYLSAGQTDMAMAYLAGYAIGPVIGQTIKGIAAVTPKIVRFSQKLYVETRLVLQLERGVTEQGVKTLLNRAVENGKVVEYIIPDNTYGNLFVKATDDEVLVGYVKTEQNKDILVVLANKKGSNSLSGKLANTTEEDVKRLADEAIGIVTDVTRAKNILKQALDTDTFAKLIADFGEDSPNLIRFVDNGKVNDDFIESWKVLKPNKPDLCKDINVIEILAKVRKNPNLTKHGITDEMLAKIQGFSPPAVSYAEILKDLEKVLDILPADKTKNFVEVISNGDRGLVNNSGNLAYTDRRHSWYTLKMIQDNEAFFRDADEITFEKRLENLEHLNNAVPDIYIKKGDITYIGEVYAGQTGVKTNLSTQSIRYMNDVENLENLRFFCHKSQDKAAIIDAWKKGGVLDDDGVFNLFKKYDENIMLDKLVDKNMFERYLRENDQWFELIFNSNF